jgi:SAM-dependent methyltransferase
MRKIVELIRIFKEVGPKQFFKVLRINRQVVPLVSGFALTQAIGTLQQLGFFEMLERAPASSEELARALSLRTEVLEPLLEYLCSAKVLYREANRWQLSAYGRFISLEPHGLFLLFRAYGPIFTHLSDLLKGKAEYGKDIRRDELWMATGSSQIVKWLPIPVVANWLSKFQCRTLIDVGCGAGDFLGELNRRLGGCRLIGVDRSPEIVQLAQKRNPGGQNRPIAYSVVDAMSETDLEDLRATVAQADAISIMFVLHELVYSGVDVARKFLTNLRQAYPTARLFICEIMRPPPYSGIRSGSELLLYHALSHQRPLPLEDWTKLFTESGYRIEQKKTFELMSQAYFMLAPQSAGNPGSSAAPNVPLL